MSKFNSPAQIQKRQNQRAQARAEVPAPPNQHREPQQQAAQQQQAETAEVTQNSGQMATGVGDGIREGSETASGGIKGFFGGIGNFARDLVAIPVRTVTHGPAGTVGSIVNVFNAEAGQAVENHLTKAGLDIGVAKVAGTTVSIVDLEAGQAVQDGIKKGGDVLGKDVVGGIAKFAVDLPAKPTGIVLGGVVEGTGKATAGVIDGVSESYSDAWDGATIEAKKDGNFSAGEKIVGGVGAAVAGTLGVLPELGERSLETVGETLNVPKEAKGVSGNIAAGISGSFQQAANLGETVLIDPTVESARQFAEKFQGPKPSIDDEIAKFYDSPTGKLSEYGREMVAKAAKTLPDEYFHNLDKDIQNQPEIAFKAAIGKITEAGRFHVEAVGSTGRIDNHNIYLEVMERVQQATQERAAAAARAAQTGTPAQQGNKQRTVPSVEEERVAPQAAKPVAAQRKPSSPASGTDVEQKSPHYMDPEKAEMFAEVFKVIGVTSKEAKDFWINIDSRLGPESAGLTDASPDKDFEAFVEERYGELTPATLRDKLIPEWNKLVIGASPAEPSVKEAGGTERKEAPVAAAPAFKKGFDPAIRDALAANFGEGSDAEIMEKLTAFRKEMGVVIPEGTNPWNFTEADKRALKKQQESRGSQARANAGRTSYAA